MSDHDPTSENSQVQPTVQHPQSWTPPGSYADNPPASYGNDPTSSPLTEYPSYQSNYPLPIEPPPPYQQFQYPPELNPYILANLAKIWQRLAALVIDLLLLSVVFYILELLTQIEISLFSIQALGSSVNFFIGYLLVRFTIIMGYFIYPYSHSGQTIGKKLLHIKVIRLDQSALTIQTGLARSIPLLVIPIIQTAGMILFYRQIASDLSPIYILCILLGCFLTMVSFLFAIGSNQNKAIHDALAQTVVVVETPKIN